MAVIDKVFAHKYAGRKEGSPLSAFTYTTVYLSHMEDDNTVTYKP